ncbi:ATP synthase F0 subcomplex subunit OSCP atp5 [Acarospora aff. strigata]|nr:ATP synthase F0 subcomplex subunit OSCP atp5 [Acarospora aff. strigata]
MLSSRAILPLSRTTASRATIGPRSVVPFGIRTYAQAAPAVDSKPPVALFGLDGTYASALYTAAAKSSTLDSTAKSLAALSDVFKKDPKLPVILTAPSLTPGDKSQIVQELQRHMGGVDKGDTVKNFLNTLAENNRLGILEGVCEKFSMLMGAYRGEMELTITSAAVRTLSCPDPSRSEETSLTSLKKLDSKVLQRLETAIAKSEYSQGKKLKVVPKINPDILGGLIVEIGDRTIDRAVSSKISRMNKALTDAL